MTWVALCLAAGVGFVLGQIGRWIERSRLESRLRAVGREARAMEDMGDTVPAEWVADQIEWVLNKELRA